jgi:hypothetical protein
MIGQGKSALDTPALLGRSRRYGSQHRAHHRHLSAPRRRMAAAFQGAQDA